MKLILVTAISLFFIIPTYAGVETTCEDIGEGYKLTISNDESNKSTFNIYDQDGHLKLHEVFRKIQDGYKASLTSYLWGYYHGKAGIAILDVEGLKNLETGKYNAKAEIGINLGNLIINQSNIDCSVIVY